VVLAVLLERREVEEEEWRILDLDDLEGLWQ
jgi:hypothetical protein